MKHAHRPPIARALAGVALSAFAVATSVWLISAHVGARAGAAGGIGGYYVEAVRKGCPNLLSIDGRVGFTEADALRLDAWLQPMQPVLQQAGDPQ